MTTTTPAASGQVAYRKLTPHRPARRLRVPRPGAEPIRQLEARLAGQEPLPDEAQ